MRGNVGKGEPTRDCIGDNTKGISSLYNDIPSLGWIIPCRDVRKERATRFRFPKMSERLGTQYQTQYRQKYHHITFTFKVEKAIPRSTGSPRRNHHCITLTTPNQPSSGYHPAPVPEPRGRQSSTPLPGYVPPRAIRSSWGNALP